MKTSIPLALAATLPLASCFLTSCADSPAPSPRAVDGNPLLGSWTMDVQESLKRSDDLAKSRGLSSQIQSLNRSMLRRNEGSVRTFTATETALVTPDHLKYADEYRIKESTPAGVTIALGEGGTTTYTLESGRLVHTQPRTGVVTVYRRR